MALPTINGPTGLVTMPTAEVMEYKESMVAFDYQSNISDSNANQSFYKMNVGALENTEFGFVGGSRPEEGVFLNFKWAMSSNAERFPLKMAVGFENLTSNQRSDFYIVTSKKLRVDIGFHAGFKALFADELGLSFMVGTDYSYSDDLVVMADFSSFQGGNYYLNVGANYKLMELTSIDNLYFRLSAENILHNVGQDTYVNVGFAYTNQM